MASLKLIDTVGASKGEVEASDAIFDVAPNEVLVHEVIVASQNAKRQGTHKTKERAEVRGGGAKPFRQKGTGHARQGSSREPHMRGGGTVFGPRPRSYRQKVPARSRRQALCCVLSDRARNDKLSVLDNLQVDAPKTKPFAKMMDSVAPEGRKTLLVVASPNKAMALSARNIQRVTLRAAGDVNALDVVGAVRVVIQKEALPTLEERLT